MDPISIAALGIYLVGIVMFVGGIVYFILRKRKLALVIAGVGVLVAILPFAANIWLAHGP